MNEPVQIERIDGIGIFRPVGSCTLPRAVAMIAAAIAQGRLLGLAKMVIDINGLSGFQPPSLSERHRMVREWADAAQGRLRIAMVTPTVFNDPEKFGVITAANFGLTAEVFRSEVEAIAWLQTHGQAP